MWIKPTHPRSVLSSHDSVQPIARLRAMAKHKLDLRENTVDNFNEALNKYRAEMPAGLLTFGATISWAGWGHGFRLVCEALRRE